MRYWPFNILLAILAVTGIAAVTTPGAPPGPDVLLRIDLGPDTAAGRVELAAAPLLPLALEALPRPYVLARSDEAGLAWLAEKDVRFVVLDSWREAATYCLAVAKSIPDAELAGATILAEDGDRVLFRRDAGDARRGCIWPAWPLAQPLRLLPRPAKAIPASVTPVPQIQDIVDQVDVTRLMDTVRELSGEQPALVASQPYTIETRHTFSGDSLNLATGYAFERLARLGLEVAYHHWEYNGTAYPPNVVAEKPGASRPDDIVIIGAHIDSTIRNFSGPYPERAPGADDNASGAAAVLMAAELLAPYTFEATLRFVLFTGEEQGMWGSRAYADAVSEENIQGMLNLDMIAWDSKDGPDVDLHAKEALVPASVALATLFTEVVAAYDLDLMPVTYSSGISASDHSSFWNQGFPAILAIENYSGDGATGSDFNSHYHSTGDLSIVINQDYFREMTRAALATFAHMGGLRSDCHWADLDCSCRVEALDVATAAGRWGASQGQWQYHRVYDFDSNGAITVRDLQAFAGQWGWTCQP